MGRPAYQASAPTQSRVGEGVNLPLTAFAAGLDENRHAG
jgi:hypothetical protein